MKYTLEFKPTPPSFKFDQPKVMGEREKGIWLGIVIGISLSALFFLLAL